MSNDNGKTWLILAVGAVAGIGSSLIMEDIGAFGAILIYAGFVITVRALQWIFGD